MRVRKRWRRTCIGEINRSRSTKSTPSGSIETFRRRRIHFWSRSLPVLRNCNSLIPANDPEPEEE
ncbi:unnamed protein product [Ectocarpus sp. 12 AP-2014]